MLGFEFTWTKLIVGVMGLISFIEVSIITPIYDFMMWLPFGKGWFASPYLFVSDHYAIMLAVLFPLLFLQKTKNVYILTAMGVLFYLFLYFVWL